MPRIAISIYIDNHEVVQYPIEYICSRLAWADEIWIHAGDDVTYPLVKASCEKFPNVRFHVVHHKVREPKDIAIGRTKCFDWLRHNTTCDWLVALSADTLPTDAAKDYIIDRCNNDMRTPESVSTHMSALYLDAGWSYWGCTVFHRSYVQDWAEDGSYFKDGGGQGGTRLALCIHLGYISTDALGRHLLQHSKTWNHNVNVQHALEYKNLTRDQFIEQRLIDMRDKRMMSGHTASRFIPRILFVDEPEFWAADTTGELPYREVGKMLSDEYVRAIQAMGLREDLDNVRSIANRIGRDRQSP